MSVFGHGSFDNDSASDLYFEFLQNPSRETISFYLFHPSAMTDSFFGQRAIAAAELTALYLERNKRKDLAELNEAFNTKPMHFKSDDILKAVVTLNDILLSSQTSQNMKNLYPELYGDWKKNIEDLVKRLLGPGNTMTNAFRKK